MANGGLVHDAYVVISADANGKITRKLYFENQSLDVNGQSGLYIGDVYCNNPDVSGEVYKDGTTYLKFLTDDTGALVGNCDYDPITEWACPQRAVIVLNDNSYRESYLAYNMAVASPAMAQISNSAYEDIADDELIVDLTFQNFQLQEGMTEADVQKKFPYDKSALLRRIEQAKLYDAADYSSTTFDALTAAITEAQTVYEDTSSASDDYKTQIAKLDEAIANLAAPSISLKGYQATLTDDVTLQFVLDIPDSDLQDTADSGKLAATITNPDGTTESTFVSATGGAYYVNVSVAPKEIANEITVSVEDATFTTSVQAYLEKLIAADGTSESDIALAKALLNYGGYAQTYFKAKDATVNAYLSDTLANANIDSALSEPTVSAFEAPALGDNISLYGVALTCDYQTAIKVYYRVSDDVTAHTFTANGVTVTPTEVADGVYVVTYSGISAANLSTAYTFGVDDVTFTYGAYNYVSAVMNAESVSSGAHTELQNMVKALYAYGEAAKG